MDIEISTIKAAMAQAETTGSQNGEHGIDLQARIMQAVLALVPNPAPTPPAPVVDNEPEPEAVTFVDEEDHSKEGSA